MTPLIVVDRIDCDEEAQQIVKDFGGAAIYVVSKQG